MNVTIKLGHGRNNKAWTCEAAHTLTADISVLVEILYDTFNQQTTKKHYSRYQLSENSNFFKFT